MGMGKRISCEALTSANESTKPSFPKYPTQQYYRSYHTSSDEGRDRPAKVNPELVPHLIVCGEPRVSISQGEMVHLEQALLSSRDTQNFLFWLMGTLVTLMSDSEALPKEGPMLQQMVLSIQ